MTQYSANLFPLPLIAEILPSILHRRSLGVFHDQDFSRGFTKMHNQPKSP
jgi:hypothetical protein